VLEVGQVIGGRYRLLSLVGEGGMGVVYEALNTRIEKRVAVKIMHTSIATDDEAITRFHREAQAATRIGSAHIVDVLDLGELTTGERYIVMEFLDGESLGQRLKREGALLVEEAIEIGIQMLDGLSKVHEAGIIHRDLKPANVFLAHVDNRTFVKLLDFGVCKIIAGVKEDSITQVGQLLGTPAYMAPEAIEHGPGNVDLRADIYSVGMILRRALAGELPYKARTVVELLVKMRAGRPPSLVEVAPEIDKALSEIVDRAIDWDPAERFRSALDFKGALQRWKRKGRDVDKLLSDFLGLRPGAPVEDVAVPKPPRTPGGASGADGVKKKTVETTARMDRSTTRRKRPKPELEPAEIEVDLDDDAETIPLKARPRKRK